MAISKIPMRRIFVTSTVASILIMEGLSYIISPWIRAAYLLILPLMVLGIIDMAQHRQAIRRNFPLIGRFRYLMETIRPEIMQYFIESDIDGRPFDRRRRSNIYQRAKKQLNTRPFGTLLDVYEDGYEWISHSISAKHLGHDEPRVLVGGKECTQPYSASIFNISAMSYGSLSANAVLALNRGAKKADFAHNTGEGGISPYHLKYGGDLIWQIGTGYFGCRTLDGNFCPDSFKERAHLESVKMIEIKLSQGAKPGHGGILPAKKVTPEIAEIRGVPMGADVISPPYHRAFDTPKGLLHFVAQLRELSGGKPIGFKLCVGKPQEFFAIAKAMVETGITPDFITVDGAEGGTGAAPIEFSDSVGMPLTEGLILVQNTLVGLGLRQQIRLLCAGKISNGFDLIRKIAIGADICYSARGMMFALGCIQALECHSNICPTGVATQNPDLIKGLVVEDKYIRVANFHDETIATFIELLGAAGYDKPGQLSPADIYRRISSTEVRNFAQIYEFLESGSLLRGVIPVSFQPDWDRATPESFMPKPQSVTLA